MGSEESLPLFPINKRALSIRGKGMATIPFMFVPSHPIETLDISGNEIRKLPTELIRLKQLNYSSNKLKKLSRVMMRAIRGYLSLSELALSDNELGNGFKALTEIKTMRKLILSGNKISAFSEDCQHLETLDLARNVIKSFSTIGPKLVSLNLSFNRLTEIEFVSVTLRELNLSGNDIRVLPEGLKFIALDELDVSFNKLSTLAHIEEFAPNLQTLRAGFNHIEELPSRLPVNIRDIEAPGNRITSIPDLSGLVRLRKLIINHNFITQFPVLNPEVSVVNVDYNRMADSQPIRAGKLNVLILTGNMFEEIPDMKCANVLQFSAHNNCLTRVNMMKMCRLLIKCDLSGNKLTSVPGELFLLRELRYLILTNNAITEIPDEVAKSVIQTLAISENPLSELPPLPKSLVVLSACCCQFEHFPEEVAKLTTVLSLDFSNNRIRTFPRFERAEVLLMSCNEITECGYIGDNVRILDLSHNSLTSFSLDRAFGTLKELNISHNKLTEFNVQEALPALQSLRVSHNHELAMRLNMRLFPVLDCIDNNMTPMTLRFIKTCRLLREVIVESSPTVNRRVKVFNDMSVAYSEMTGERPSMEDSLIIRVTNDIRILAVIDGHGGFRTSCYAADTLPTLIEEFTTEAVVTALSNMNELLRDEGIGDGATIAMVVQQGNKIIAANVGDSRALIIRRDGLVVPLSYDHKPYERSEMLRLRDLGTFVAEERVAGALAISRALGDFSIKGVMATPCIAHHDITEDDLRLVIACDGAFDVLTNDEVADIVTSESDCWRAASKLRNIAYARNSTDNISVIVADLHRDFEPCHEGQIQRL